MTGFNTAAFNAQDQLLALFTADAQLAAWTIDYGLPPGRLPNDLHIWIDEKIDSWTQDSELTGLVAKDEQFRLSVYIYARRTGATAVEVRREVSEAGARIAFAIGSTPFIGGSVMYSQIVALDYEGGFADAEGRRREGVLRVTVGCSAFITGA